MSKKKKIARRGEFWTINDKRTRGHKSHIVRGNRYYDYVWHLPITHHDKTRNMKNQRLIENPEFSKTETSYILKKFKKQMRKV